jgi:hypothetical protein
MFYYETAGTRKKKNASEIQNGERLDSNDLNHQPSSSALENTANNLENKQAKEPALEENTEPPEPEYTPTWPNFLNELVGRKKVIYIWKKWL